MPDNETGYTECPKLCNILLQKEVQKRWDTLERVFGISGTN